MIDPSDALLEMRKIRQELIRSNEKLRLEIAKKAGELAAIDDLADKLSWLDKKEE